MEGKIGDINKIMLLCYNNTKDNEVFGKYIDKYLNAVFLKSTLKSYKKIDLMLNYTINFMKNNGYLYQWIHIFIQ